MESRANELDGRVEELIGAAVMAHAYRDAIRRDPRIAAGFGRLRDKQRRRVAALCDQIGRTAVEDCSPPAAPVVTMDIRSRSA